MKSNHTGEGQNKEVQIRMMQKENLKILIGDISIKKRHQSKQNKVTRKTKKIFSITMFKNQNCLNMDRLTARLPRLRGKRNRRNTKREYVRPLRRAPNNKQKLYSVQAQ